MSVANIQKLLDNIDSIPRLPMTAIKLSQVLSDPDSSMKDIAEVIQYDQSITSELLKLCNSAYFGFAENITTAKDAIVKLGTTKVFQLVLASSSRALLNREIEGYALPMGALWKQSIGAALAAQRIGREKRSPLAGMAFTTALLNDIGKIVLNQHMTEDYRLVLKKVEDEKITFNQAEHDVLGMSHAEIGAELGIKWQLPDEMINAIRYHHEVEKAPNPDDELLLFVHVGDYVAINLGFGLGVDGLLYQSSINVEEVLDIDLARFEVICSEIMTDFVDVKQLFSE